MQAGTHANPWAPLDPGNTRMVALRRDNILEHLICRVRDCGMAYVGVPVDAHGRRSTLCSTRKRRACHGAACKLKANLNTSVLLSVLEALAADTRLTSDPTPLTGQPQGKPAQLHSLATHELSDWLADWAWWRSPDIRHTRRRSMSIARQGFGYTEVVAEDLSAFEYDHEHLHTHAGTDADSSTVSAAWQRSERAWVKLLKGLGAAAVNRVVRATMRASLEQDRYLKPLTFTERRNPTHEG